VNKPSRMLIIGLLAVSGAGCNQSAHRIEAQRQISQWFTPGLSRVDRAIIGGCRSVLSNNETAAEKAAHLVAMQCARYSDQQMAQIDKDVEKCAANAAAGDRVLNQCLEAANGY
jgi:hypothetical protein